MTSPGAPLIAHFAMSGPHPAATSSSRASVSRYRRTNRGLAHPFFPALPFLRLPHPCAFFKGGIRLIRLPRLDKTFLKKATIPPPSTKNQRTIRLDEDVLAWLKRQGKGYQTRINRILRVVMESQPH